MPVPFRTGKRSRSRLDQCRRVLWSPLRTIILVSLFALSPLACGGTKPRVDASPTNVDSPSDGGTSQELSDGAASEPVAEKGMPTKCATPGSDMCVPPNDFVERLCNKNFAEAALVLFAKDSPWTRMYMTGSVEAWYASGGAALRAKLMFDEEVIVLRRRVPPKGGMVIGDGSGGFDVLRWDGYCYSLEAGQVTTKLPPAPRRALVKFFRLGKRMQDAMLESKQVTAAYAKRMKECGGATAGEVTLACEKADLALSNATIDFVRLTSALPPPENIP